MKNILHIYCGSIGDQTFGIQSTAISSVGIEEVYCDGKSVFLPPTLSLFDTIEENEAAYTAIAAVQAAAVAFDTFSFDLEKLDFMNEIRERYALIPPDIMENAGKHYQNSARMVRERATGEIEALFDGERTLLLLQTPHEQFFYLFPAPDLARELFILIELCRIEAMLAARYNGLKADFTALHNAILARQPARMLPADRSSQFEYLIDITIRIALGDLQQSIRGAQRIDRQIAQITEQINGIRFENQTTYDSARITATIYNLLYENYPVVLWCRENDIRTLFAPYLEMTICPEVVFDVSPGLFTGVKERPVFEDLEEPEEREIDLTSMTQSERKAFELKQAILSGDIRIYRYPEYDVLKGDYEQKYCTLYESVLQGGNAGWFGKVLFEHQRVYKKLKKRFLMMEPEELQVSRRWLQGDEIHLGDAVDYITDLFRGECPDEKIYLKRIRNIRDIAAAVLIDASSSTNEPVGDTTVLQIEKTAVALLASVLSEIGDTFGIYSFFSMGRNNIFFSIAKDFNEPWNETVQSRIESIEANAGNRDGCAIRHVTERLLDRPEKTKLLLMLSDGIPADAEYGDGVGETGEYAIEDTRKAILEARIKGIIPYCITIDRRARDYTPHLYGEYHFTVLDEVTQLPEKLSRLYFRLTQ
jgi:nitric oxide reductase NorD protein